MLLIFYQRAQTPIPPTTTPPPAAASAALGSGSSKKQAAADKNKTYQVPGKYVCTCLVCYTTGRSAQSC